MSFVVGFRPDPAGMLRRAFSCIVLIGYLLGLLPFPASVAMAASFIPGSESPAASVPTEISYNGAFTQRIDLRVPEFRGLEPSLGLVYDSGRVNSYGPEDFVGAGWRLSGLSVIQRASRKRGLPAFDGTDIYLLDGQELLECGSSQSAGCGSGGTHATWVEGYQRIRYRSEDNLWEITGRDGTRYVYAALAHFGSYATSDSAQHSLANIPVTCCATRSTRLVSRLITTMPVAPIFRLSIAG